MRQPTGDRVIAIPTLAALTSINCLNSGSKLDGTGGRAIFQIFEETPRIRTLCGFAEGVKTIDLREALERSRGAGDLALLTADVMAGRATSAVTSMDCRADLSTDALQTLIQFFESTPRIRTLCGLKEGVKKIDWSNKASGSDLALLGADLRVCRAAADVTHLALGSNERIGDDSVIPLLDTLKDVSLTSFDISKNTYVRIPTLWKLVELVSEETKFAASVKTIDVSGIFEKGSEGPKEALNKLEKACKKRKIKLHAKGYPAPKNDDY